MRQTAWLEKVTSFGGTVDSPEEVRKREVDLQKLENVVRHLRWARMMLHEMANAHNGEEFGWELYRFSQRVATEEHDIDAVFKKLSEEKRKKI